MNDSEKASKFSVNLGNSGINTVLVPPGLPMYSRSLLYSFKKRLVKTSGICYNSREY